MILWMTWHVWMHWAERKRSVALRMSVWVWLCYTSLTRPCRLALLYRMWPSRPGVGFSFLQYLEEDLKAILKRKLNKSYTIYKTADRLSLKGSCPYIIWLFFHCVHIMSAKVFFSTLSFLLLCLVDLQVNDLIAYAFEVIYILIEIQRFPAVTHKLQVCYQIQFLNCPILQICYKPWRP